jgi:integrase
LARRS